MKERFSAEEWAELCSAPFIAGMYVASAGEGSRAQYTQEMVALAEGLRASVARGGPLAAAVAADLASRAGNRLGTGAAAASPDERPTMLRRVARVGATLACAGGEEAAAYRRWVLGLAAEVAGAASDGGLLGIGGRRVSYAEQVALRELAEALGGA
jgi:hypothetical protein